MKLTNEILSIIEKDSKLTYEEIAVMTGSDKETVEKIIKELEEKKVIFGYKALINWEKVENNKITAYIELKVTPEEGHGFEKIADDIITECPQIKSISLMSGGFDLLIEIEGDNMKDIALFVAEKISPLSSVVSTRTHFVLRNYKQDGILLNDNTKDEVILLLGKGSEPYQIANGIKHPFSDKKVVYDWIYKNNEK